MAMEAATVAPAWTASMGIGLRATAAIAAALMPQVQSAVAASTGLRELWAGHFRLVYERMSHTLVEAMTTWKSSLLTARLDWCRILSRQS